jgi:hypothetical protein
MASSPQPSPPEEEREQDFTVPGYTSLKRGVNETEQNGLGARRSRRFNILTEWCVPIGSNLSRESNGEAVNAALRRF